MKIKQRAIRAARRAKAQRRIRPGNSAANHTGSRPLADLARAQRTESLIDLYRPLS
jgi:hypothetical protein